MAKKACVIERPSGNKVQVSVPRFRPKLGKWTGGDSRTLYAFTDNRTGKVFVKPGHKHDLLGVGPEATVRVATKEEAEKHWQDPLHVGWKVACDD